MNNGKDNSELKDVLEEQARVQEGTVIEQLASQEDVDPPINPVKQYKGSRKGAAYAYYQDVAPKLREWWDEFNTQLNDDGKLKYRTIIGFAREKGKTSTEKQLLLEMLGPQPQVKDGRQLRVPWLGDWQKRRDNGFWAPKQSAEMKELAVTMRRKMVGWDAIQATGPYLAMGMATIEKFKQQVHDAFGGMAFDVNQSPLSEPNQERYRVYTGWIWDLELKRIRLLTEYWRANGMDVDGKISTVHIQALAAQIGSPVGLAEGGQTAIGDGQTLPREQLETLKLARMLQAHAGNYNLKSPIEAMEEDKTITVEPEPQKKNGKEKVQ